MDLSLQQHHTVIYYPFRIGKDISICVYSLTRVRYVLKIDFQPTFSKVLFPKLLVKNEMSEKTATSFNTR